jgi:hypothetical protein
MNCKMKYCEFVAVFLLVLSGGTAVWAAQESEDRAVPVSLIRVIANPEKFDGHRLRVIGVLSSGGGLDQAVCLYVSETDARNAVMSNCIYVQQSFDKGDRRLGKYVILNATFHYVDHGHGLESFSFEHISDMRLWPSMAEK